MTHRRIRFVATTLVTLALLALPAAAQVKDHRDIEFPELPEFKIARPEVHTLDNGLKLFLMEDHELPLISVSARIRTGAYYEPADKTGLAGIFGQAMREGGTTSMSGDEIDDFLAARAAFVETGVGGDSGSASMNCLKESFDDVFGVFIDVLRHPIFEQEKIDLAKRQVKTSIARRNDEIAQIAGREFRRLIYGYDSPLSRMTEYATVDAVTREELIAWHKKYYHPNNISLGVVGDFDPATMKAKIEQALGDWPAGPEAGRGEVAFSVPAPGVHFIEKSDVTQAYVRMGHLGIETKNPDYFAVQVMNEVFGGGFAGRLFSNVRSDKGLAYSVGGGVGSSFLRPGVFSVALSTKSETMAEAVDALKEEIDGIIAGPPTPDEMSRAKESILNSFIFNYTSKRQILNQQMTYAYYGMPEDFLEQYRANIEKVSSEDVARVARKYIHPDKLVLLVVGKSDDFDRPVSSFGKVAEVDITIPPPPDTTPEVVKTAESLEAGSKLFAKAAKRITGGRKVQSVTSDSTVTLNLGGQAMTLGQTVNFVLPDKLRMVMKTPMGDQAMVINGRRGFASAAGQSRPLPGEMVSEQLQDLNRELLVLAGSLGQSDLKAFSGGSTKIEGTPCDIAAVSLDGSEARLCIDADGNVIRQSYQGKHPMQRTPGKIEVLYSDYREVDGWMVPHKQVMTFEGEELATISVDSIAINGAVESTWFELPEGE